MSVENAKKFREDFKENEEIKEKIKKELEICKDSGQKEKELIPEIYVLIFAGSLKIIKKLIKAAGTHAIKNWPEGSFFFFVNMR